MPGIDPITQDSILGLMILNQDVLATDIIAGDEGLYFSRLFKKPSNHAWYQISWASNKEGADEDNVDIDVRLRTGDSLPYSNYSTRKRYTLDQYNDRIKTTDSNDIDYDLYKWCLGRSLLGTENGDGTITSDRGISELGTSKNTTRLGASDDSIWNYWSLPFLHSKAYISNNVEDDYIQLRINLRSIDNKTPAEMYNITISSLLKKGS